MTIVAQEPTAAHPQTGAAPPPSGVHPWISANRALLVPRFPSLGFTVSTGGLAFWEVLLFTDRSLVDPANAG